MNWTKVGLKDEEGSGVPQVNGCLNWTKVGLKEHQNAVPLLVITSV